jgi:dipeptidyl aminopeptidase/acylaminoacyl peptidase
VCAVAPRAVGGREKYRYRSSPSRLSVQKLVTDARGVTGEGWKLHNTIMDWGIGLAFEDIMDGIDSLVAQGIADPARLGIGGWSNGGFMSLWSITHTTRFKAAAVYAALSDFRIIWSASETSATLYNKLWGNPLQQHANYDAHSPFQFVQDCTTPTLILHGENDRIVPIAQEYEFYRALRANGVEAKLVVYPREGHVMNEKAHQIDMQERVLAWYEAHLK